MPYPISYDASMNSSTKLQGKVKIKNSDKMSVWILEVRIVISMERNRGVINNRTLDMGKTRWKLPKPHIQPVQMLPELV